MRRITCVFAVANGQRVRARRALEVAEPQPEDDRPPDRRAARNRRVIRSTMPTRMRRSPPPSGARARARAASRSSRAACRGSTRAEVAVVRERAELTARRPAEHGDERRLRERSKLADRPHVPRVQAPRRRRADAPDALDRQRVEKRELALGRDGDQPVGLRDAARHLREELRPRHADRDGQARPARAPQRAGARRSRPASRRCAPSRARRGTPRRSTAPRRRARRPRTRRTSRGSPRCTPRGAAGRRSRRGRAGAPAARPSPCGCRTPSPRSSPRARRRRRR